MHIFRLYRYIACLFLLSCLCSSALWAQQSKETAAALARARQRASDSARNAQKAVLDSSRAAQKARTEAARVAQQHTLDSSKTARQRTLDSVKAVRKRTTDSLTTLRKYRESKRYKDSVARSRQDKLNAARTAQKARFDALKAARQHVTDSTTALRKRGIDSMRAIQKRRADSLGAIRKYRESKRFKDSVIIVRKVQMDRLKAVRKAYNDSVFAVRKKTIDSAKAERKRMTDSATAARTKITDSLKAVRKVRADSLAKIKADKERQAKAKTKQNELLANMKFELKLKQKRSVYSNDKMLKKKWSLPRKVVQNTFTRYNYYFNARKKMDEAELNMQRVAKDNFSEQIALFSFDPDRDSTLLLSDMDSIIQKASLGIQIHDPRTKWGDDLYLLLGQAYYYKGNYPNADASFRYIIGMRAKQERDKAQKNAYSNRSVRSGGRKEATSVVEEDKGKLLDFLKHQSVNNEALLWVARTSTQSGRLEQAESVLDILGNDAKFPDNLRGRLALEKAFLALKQENNREAATQLAIVSADGGQPYWIRRRAAFLAGQLYEADHKYLAAAQQYEQVTDLQPKIDMDFYARRNRANNLMLTGERQEEAIASLKHMLNDGKYSSYNEQIYYILGQLSVNSNNPAEAEVYLTKSINAPKTTRKQKASSFASLGNIYYRAGSWERAKNAYDSAAKYGGANSDDTAVLIARKRARVLDDVSSPERTIRSKDSLLALGALPDKEQRAVVRRYLRTLERRRADSAVNAANAVNAPGNEPDAADPGAMTWYFSNEGLKQQGQNEFRRKWGNRPLVDNWQRGAAIGAAGGSQGGNAVADNDGSGTTGSSADAGEDADAETALLAYIPRTAQSREEAQRIIQRAYVDLSGAYLTGLEDYSRATVTLDTFDKRFPVSLYADEALYNRYLIALRSNNLKGAQDYSNQLQQRYPNSKWAAMVKPDEGNGAQAAGAPQAGVAAYYDETYQLLQQRQYQPVITRAREGRQRYRDEVYSSRFQIMEAMAQAGTGNYRTADTMLNEFIRTHQQDSLRVWADNVLRYVQELKKADTLSNRLPATDSAAGAAVHPVTPPAVPGLTPDSATARPADPVPAAFTYKPGEEHYFIFYFKEMSSKVMGVKAGLTDFNNIKFSGQSLQANVALLQNGNKGLVVVRSFPGAAPAKIYLNEFSRSPSITREFTQGEYQVMIISAKNYQKLMADRDIQPYLNFYKAKY